MIPRRFKKYIQSGDANKRRLLFWLLLALTCSACQPDRQVTPAFYYWKTTFRMEEAQQDQLAALKVKKLYLRCFDVEWNDALQGVKVVAPIRLLSPLPEGQEIIPVVFIENEVMQKADPPTLDSLAVALIEKTENLLKSTAHTELQIDCDWTRGTRDTYFAFLRTLRTQRPDRCLSTTIRLHQVRDTSTGIPPARRGMLMAYNLQSPADLQADNSILTLDLLKSYTRTLPDYPLPLDIALPVFSWGIVSEDKQFKGLIDNLRATDLEGREAFKKIGDHTWEAQKNTYIQSQLIRQGERIKIESVSGSALQQAASHLASRCNTDTLTVSLFHFAPEVIQNYPHHELESVFETFQ